MRDNIALRWQATPFIIMQSKHRIYLWQLIKEREQIVALLYILDLDIDLRRKLEQLQKTPFAFKRSLDVERAREELQGDLARVRLEMDAVLDLMEKHNG